MAIPQNALDQIQARTDIVEVISKYVPLKKAGRNYKAPCPFHNEKTPSFIVSPDKQIYHCFGCGAGGNVFSFLMRYENLQFPEVVEMLAQKAGIILPSSSAKKEALDSAANQLYRINEAACQFFQACLANNKAARDYLSSRGVGDETIKKLKIGYAADSWDALLNFLRKKGLNDAIVSKTGLVVANDKGGYYDRFRNRIVFPIIDLKDRLLGFGGRVMDSSLPKYINSPETLVYTKGRNLYGLNFSKESVKKAGHVLVVEGYLDFIVPFQAGVKNIIATLGTALTVDQIKLLKRFTNTVIMVYDPDEAGEAASLRNLDLFISEDVNVYIAELSSGLDPDSFIRKFGTEDFLKVIKKSKNLFDYKIDKLTKKFNINTTNGKAAIAGDMLPTISKINNAVMKSGLIKKLSEKLSVDEEALRIELKKVKPDYYERRYVINTVEAKKDSRSAEVMILALLLDGAKYIEKVTENLSLEEFKSSAVRDVVGVVFSLYKENKEVTPARLISHVGNSSEMSALISETVSILEAITDKDKALSDCIARIRKDNAKERLQGIQDEIKTAHNQKDEDRVKKLVAEYNSLVKAGRS